MTRRDILNCAHEPFGDAFYYGPERLSERFADDEEARVKSGFAKSTYRTIMDRLENDGKEVSILNPPSYCVLESLLLEHGCFTHLRADHGDLLLARLSIR